MAENKGTWSRERKFVVLPDDEGERIRAEAPDRSMTLERLLRAGKVVWAPHRNGMTVPGHRLRSQNAERDGVAGFYIWIERKDGAP